MAYADPAQLPPPEIFSQLEASRLFTKHARAVLPHFAIHRRECSNRRCHLPGAGRPAVGAGDGGHRPPERTQPGADRRADFRRLAPAEQRRSGLAASPPKPCRLRWTGATPCSACRKRACCKCFQCSAMAAALQALEAVACNEKLTAARTDWTTGWTGGKVAGLYHVGQAGERRYHLLQTVHLYAHEKLLESGESQSSRRRHRDYFWKWRSATATACGRANAWNGCNA